MKYFYLLLLFAITIPLASAGYFNATLVKLDRSYSTDDTIRGTINVTAIDYSANAKFTSSFGNSITLLDFLRANKIAYPGGFNCSTDNCSIPYVRQDKITSVNVRNSQASIGLTIDGLNVNSVHDSSITLTSGLAASCYLPLTIVLGNSDGVRIAPTSYNDVPCSAPLQGCFDTNYGSYVEPVIPFDGGHYCEKISLPVAPAYRLGATVLQSTSGSARIKMSLFDLDGSSLAECLLPNVTQSVQTGDCIVQYSSTNTKDYYVCVESTGTSNYKIKAESNSSCGTSNIGSASSFFDYNVYATPLQFSSPSVVINDTTMLALSGKEFSSWIQDYVFANYKNACKPYCVIPISFEGLDQTVSFSNVNVQYDVQDAQGLSSHDVYSIAKGNTTITTKGAILDLSKAAFPTSNSGNALQWTLSFEGSTIVDGVVNVSSGFDFSITPLSVPYGLPITYKVSTSNAVKTKWNFGDSPEVVSTGASVSHSYLQQGLQNVSVEVTTNNATSRKRFSIYVGDARDGANATIALYDKRILSLTTNISNSAFWVQTALSSSLNVSNLNVKLTQIKSNYVRAQNDSDYQAVMSSLLSLNVPAGIVQIRKETLPMSASFANIDTGLVESATGEAVEDAETLKSNLAYWNRKHVSSKISFRELGATYDSGVQSLVTLVSIDVKTLDSVSEPAFLLFSYSPGDVIFSQDYKQKSVTGGTSIAFENGQTFDFAVADKVTLQKLGAYVTPQNIRPLLVSATQDTICRVNNKCEADLGENVDTCPADCTGTNWKLIISLLVLFLLAGGIAVFIWTWYKKRFERTLFRNPADFYNISTFIQNSRRAGIKDAEIKKKLKKAGWTFDQIHYALSKAKPSINPQNTAIKK